MERNLAIDAWRGISISLVVVGHLIFQRFQQALHPTPFHLLDFRDVAGVIENIVLRFAAPLPELGVSFFFVISGYLITAILAREEQRNGRITIGAFYLRRGFRILPAFLVFLATVAVLAHYGLITVPGRPLLSAAFFLCDTGIGHCNWWVGHTWSLAVEEQFYLAWPLVFVLTAGRVRFPYLVFAYVALVALSYWPAAAALWIDPGIMANSFACIVVGALYATAAWFRKTVDRTAGSAGIAVAVVVLLGQPLFASVHLVERLLSPLNPLLVGYILFASLAKPNMLTAMLDWRWLQQLGIISYSLYLWQQLFTGPASPDISWITRFPLLCILPAMVSYRLIERPLIRVGHRLSATATERSHGRTPADRSRPSRGAEIG